MAHIAHIIAGIISLGILGLILSIRPADFMKRENPRNKQQNH